MRFRPDSAYTSLARMLRLLQSDPAALGVFMAANLDVVLDALDSAASRTTPAPYHHPEDSDS